MLYLTKPNVEIPVCTVHVPILTKYFTMAFGKFHLNPLFPALSFLLSIQLFHTGNQ